MAEVSDNREILIVQGRQLRPTFEATFAAGGYRYKALLNKMRRFHLDRGPGSRSTAAARGGLRDGAGHA